MEFPKITEILIENEDGFFKASLSDGGVRVGILETSAINIPPGHKAHSEALELTTDQLEDFFYNNYRNRA